MEAWNEFKGTNWKERIDVEDFIINNYTLYEGTDEFLSGVSSKTLKILNKVEELKKQELEKGVLDIETKIMSGIDAFEPGYIDKENEVIFGLQTDAPLKRIVNPYGGIRMVYNELDAYGYKLDEQVDKYFNMYRKTHNQGVFDAYTEDVRKARHVGLLTGLPDAYGRGRIIGDYRRVALYGIDYLIAEKQKDLTRIKGDMTADRIQLREDVSEQIRALNEMKSMAGKYGFDISKPYLDAIFFI